MKSHYNPFADIDTNDLFKGSNKRIEKKKRKIPTQKKRDDSFRYASGFMRGLLEKAMGYKTRRDVFLQRRRFKNKRSKSRV